jgi:hypothetical protein
MKHVIFGWILLFGLVACKYDNEQELYPAGNCLYSPQNCTGGKLPEPGPWGFSFYDPPSVITRADPNPNNDYEFIYYKPYYVESDGIGKLYKYNVRTSERLLLYAGELLSSPSWGKNGWILLNTIDRKMWRVKENGDSLQILDDSYLCHGGLWNYQGDKFMYGWQNAQTVSVGLPVRNTNWQLVDTLTRGGTSWFDNLLISAINDPPFTVGVYDLGSDQTHFLQMKTNTPNEIMTYVCWSYDGQLIYFTGGTSGLFSYDYQSGKQSWLRCQCANEFYHHLAPWGTEHLIAIRDHWKDLGQSFIEVSSTIVRIKTDGSEEIEIAVPD